ncbi:MAG: lytic transglycosylase domain-containing protein [Pseudomonadota bacterium]
MIRHVTLCAAALLLCAPEGRAETPPPFPEFSAKRVKPPKAGTTKRITVQIAPQAPAQAAPAATGAAPTPGAAGNYDWFWDAVSPDLAAGGPGRLDVALGALSSARSPVPVPRLQVMQDVARAHGRDILVSSVGTQVSPALVLAVMMVESGGDPAAVSRVGAQGLMQLMPATAEEFGVADALEPQDNIRGGVAYLNWLMKRFDGDPILVLAGYNAGPGAVRDNGGVPPFPETRDYVPKVLAAYKVARGLCMTPPQLISDGCVFAAMN